MYRYLKHSFVIFSLENVLLTAPNEHRKKVKGTDSRTKLALNIFKSEPV